VTDTRDIVPQERHYKQGVTLKSLPGGPVEVIPANARSHNLYNDGRTFRVEIVATNGLRLMLAMVDNRGNIGWYFTSTIPELARLKDTRIGFSKAPTVKAQAAKTVRRELAKLAAVAEDAEIDARGPADPADPAAQAQVAEGRCEGAREMKRSEFLKSAAVVAPGMALLRTPATSEDDQSEVLMDYGLKVETVDRTVLHDSRVIELQRLSSPALSKEDCDQWRIQWSRLVEERTGADSVDDHHLDALRYLMAPDKTRIVVTANRWGKTAAMEGRLPLDDRERASVYEVERYEDFVHVDPEQNRVMAEARFLQIAQEHAVPRIRLFSYDRPFIALAGGPVGWRRPSKHETLHWSVEHADRLHIERAMIPVSKNRSAGTGRVIDVLELPLMRSGRTVWHYPEWSSPADRMSATFTLVAKNAAGEIREFLPSIVDVEGQSDES